MMADFQKFSTFRLSGKFVILLSVGWLEFNVPFQHKYGYIRDDNTVIIKDSTTP